MLSGDLGAGKTLFTKGIANALEIDPIDVVSPSYTLMNQFQGKYTLYHIDLYRLGDESGKKIRDMGDLDDYIDEGVMVVEWAQFLDDSYFKLKQTVDVRFHITPEDQRKITIKTSLQ